MATMNDKRSTVIGVFEDRDHAVAAIRDLYNAGFPEDRIGIARRGADGDMVNAGAIPQQAAPAETGIGSTTGAVAGAVAGASMGGLVGLGILAGVIPAIGPVIAGGTLAAVLANAAGGAAIGGVLGTLTGESYPQEEANYYQAEFEAGRTIVTVDAGTRRTDAMSVIALNGGYNLDTQASRPTATTATGETRVTSGTAAGAAPGQYAHSPAETSSFPDSDSGESRS